MLWLQLNFFLLLFLIPVWHTLPWQWTILNILVRWQNKFKAKIRGLRRESAFCFTILTHFLNQVTKWLTEIWTKNLKMVSPSSSNLRVIHWNFPLGKKKYLRCQRSFLQFVSGDSELVKQSTSYNLASVWHRMFQQISNYKPNKWQPCCWHILNWHHAQHKKHRDGHWADG